MKKLVKLLTEINESLNEIAIPQDDKDETREGRWIILNRVVYNEVEALKKKGSSHENAIADVARRNGMSLAAIEKAYASHKNKISEQCKEINEQTYFEVGEEISPEEIRTGMMVDAGPYGKLWVTGTNVVGDLWTSEDRSDIRSGRGRGLRFAYVEAIKISGKWYEVEWDRNGEFYKVTGIRG